MLWYTAGLKIRGDQMSLLQKTDVYTRSEGKSAHQYYGLILALICVALALFVISVAFTPAPVDGQTPPVAPYVGP
jgi:hypothetical protein